MIAKESFLEWKAHPVTAVLMKAVADKIEQGMEELSYVAGSNPLTDREFVGKLSAFRTILDLDFDELETTE